MSKIPDSLKSISSYIKKAEELDNDTTNPDSKDVAYSCRLYAVEKAMSTMPKLMNEPESKTFILSQMSILEKDKAAITLSKPDRKMICEKFAFKVFSLADDVDRTGTVTKETARIFNAATIFFDILEQFGELTSEIQEKRKYTKFKTIDILKALKEGRTPIRGAPGEEKINETTSNLNTSVESISFTPDSRSNINNSSNSIINSQNSIPPPSYDQAIASSTTNYEIPAAPTIKPVVMPLPPFAETLPDIVRKPAMISPVSQPNPVIPTNTSTFPKVGNNNGPTPKNASHKDDAIELCHFAIAALKVNKIYNTLKIIY